MCGIYGIFSKNKVISNNWQLYGFIQNTLKHRGPDDTGLYKDEHVVLMFNRLSIIDLSDKAHQPMCNESNDIWLVYNGEIYNYIEIREKLISLGHKFKSKCDTEVIIHSYEEYGINCLNKFNGMWSFVLYDKNRKLLFCSRDRFGIKPFYYYYDKERFIFSSEIKAILKSGIKNGVNEKKLFSYLAYCHRDTDEETMFNNIYQLPPANYLIVNDNYIKQNKYWELKDNKNNGDIFVSKDDTLCQFRNIFFDAIKLRLRSDVPIGALLSGGLDSSAIVSVIDYLNKSKKLAINISTYTAAYKEEDIDESNYANVVTEKTDIPNTIVFPNINNDLSKEVEKVIYYQDEPPTSMTVFAHWYLMKELKKHNLKVIISGQGADEILAGYLEKFLGYYLVDLLKNNSYSQFINEVFLLKQKSNFRYPLIFLQLIKAIFPRKAAMIAKSLLKDRGILYLNFDFIKMNWDSYNYKNKMLHYSRLNESLLRALIQDSIPDILHYEDRNSMAFSIEQRVPFLDYRLVEFLYNLSNKMKINAGVSKVILRESLNGILPDPIRHRYSKLGFSVPVDRWIIEMQSYIEDTMHSKSFRERPYWNTNKVINLYKKQIEGNTRMGHFIWRVIACEIWHKILLEN